MDQFISEQATTYVTNLGIIRDFVMQIIHTEVGDLSGQKLQLSAALAESMRVWILMITESLRDNAVRVHNHDVLLLPALAQNANIETLFNRFAQLTNALCVLADSVFIDPPANQQELVVLAASNTYMNRRSTEIELLKLPPHRFGPKGSIKAFLMFSKQRVILCNIKRNWNLFTFPILHEIQFLIMNAIDRLELMFCHNNVRVRNHVRLGKPVLPEEPTFRKLFKRLENSIYVLCLLVEADDIKQGSAINEDEMRVILECRGVIDNLIKNIDEFILESGGKSLF